MRRLLIAALLLLASPALAQESLTQESLAANPGAVTITPVVKATVNAYGQKIRFPQGDGQVAMWVYDIPPGAALPVHRHPAPRLAYVLEGTLRVRLADSPESKTLHQGEALIESVNLWHSGENPGETPLKLLVIDLQPAGAGNPTEMRR